MTTLAARVEQLDAARFQGRHRELRALEAMLALDSDQRVVLLHGPGGMGKSALLRELARRARALGYTPHTLDGRELVPVPGEIERVLDGVDSQRPLLVFDSYERMSGLDGWVRGTLLPSLPDAARVILSGRHPPAESWFRDGWEHVSLELELEPLGVDDAYALLAAHGVRDRSLAEELVRLGEGWPLALALGAAHPTPLTDGELISHPELLHAVLARMTRFELETGDSDVIAVAALARSCDARLLRRVLPGGDADARMAWLRGLTFAERVGERVTVHDLVRRALRADLEARYPDRARDLRRRIADHVHELAVAGEPRLLIDLTELIDDRALRWGFGAEGSVEYRIDGVRTGDVAALAPWYESRPRWWRDVAAFVQEAPDHVVLARDARDQLAGLSISVTLDDPPAIAERDAVLAPWLGYARDRMAGKPVLLWRDATDFTRNADPASPVVSLMNTAAIIHSRLANVRYSFIPLDARNGAAVNFSHAVGGRAVPELAVELDGRELECHIIDHGDGGMIGQIREIVYAELQLSAAAPPTISAVAEDVRGALRDLHRPVDLARSPLATGATVAARAASVRALVDEGLELAFGDTPGEELLRAVLQRGYLDPASKHELVAAELNLSRTAYFRRLRQATERLASWLVERA